MGDGIPSGFPSVWFLNSIRPGMNRRILVILTLLTTGALGLKAQDYTVPDGPLVKADSLKTPPLHTFPPLGAPVSLQLRPTGFPDMEYAFETKEQRAARINAMISADVSGSLNQYLRWDRPPKLSLAAKLSLFAARMLFTSPYSFPKGTVPMMNASFPFIYAYVPGQAPYEYPYSTARFPQCVRLEYDALSGTYKQVMVPWTEFQFNMEQSYGAYRNEPVPRVSFNSTDRLGW